MRRWWLVVVVTDGGARPVNGVLVKRSIKELEKIIRAKLTNETNDECFGEGDSEMCKRQ